MKCSNEECGSTEFVKNGSKRYRTGKHQMYQCITCGASKKGEVLESLPKGKAPDIEIRAGPEKKPDLMKLMKEL
jgi:hypothetical protein